MVSSIPIKIPPAKQIEDIVRVCNPLAHNRAVPENELKRAEVYCTDVLMLLQRVS